jgi:hypothetical protein
MSTGTAAVAPSTIVQPRAFGSRWFSGVGFDHAFPLSSLLIEGDIFAEKFQGLYPNVDWTAELGLRREVTPSLVLDTGAGWHFAGTIRSVSIVVGAMYEFATAPLFGR